MSDVDALPGAGPGWGGYTQGDPVDDPRHEAFIAEFTRLAESPALAAAGELASALTVMDADQRWTRRAGAPDEFSQHRDTGASRARAAEVAETARQAAAVRVGDPVADRVSGWIEATVRELPRAADPMGVYNALHRKVLEEAYRAGDVAAWRVHEQIAQVAADTAQRMLADLGRSQPGSPAAWQHEQSFTAHMQAHPYLVAPSTRSAPSAAAAAAAALQPRRGGPGRARTSRTADRAGRPPLRVLPGGLATGTGTAAAAADPARRPEGRRL